MVIGVRRKESYRCPVRASRLKHHFRRSTARVFAGEGACGPRTSGGLSPAEQEEIAEQLRELRQYVVRTYSLSGLQARLLEEKLDYLTAAASRVGRKDWLLMAAGLMLSYVMEAALPPEAARDILGMLLTSIGHILGRGHLGLSGG